MNQSAKNLWVLTEEHPKENVLQMIFSYFASDYKFGFLGGHLQIIPILDKNKCFSFTYEVKGFTCSKLNRIFIKTISGNSSFTDFLIFYQKEQPTTADIPIYAIEVTKTDDSESRNTGVYQRCSKFVFIQNYYPKTKMLMLYDLSVPQKETPTETYIFGTRLLRTLGVEILGKNLDEKVFCPFFSIDEVITFKNSMRSAPKGNVSIRISKTTNKIQISGRLLKGKSLSHDPNIGALSLISAVLRRLGWKKTIEITQHGLSQKHVGIDNKFVLIANSLDIKLNELKIPNAKRPDEYWHYDVKGEKLGTIFIHIITENFTQSYSVFENHAGCEKGYFQTSTGEHIPLAKYTDKAAYKAGDKSKIVSIPDLVLLDIAETEAITIEGKKYEFRHKGIAELNRYDPFEKIYLKKYYPKFRIVRTVVLYGSNEERIGEMQVGFLLNKNGKLILGIRAPQLFHQAVKNLLDFWK